MLGNVGSPTPGRVVSIEVSKDTALVGIKSDNGSTPKHSVTKEFGEEIAAHLAKGSPVYYGRPQLSDGTRKGTMGYRFLS
jgi:hypothetical protein